MRAGKADPFRLALFWLGIQAVWGALLGISLQSRTIELVPSGALVAYSYLARDGAFVAAIVQLGIGFWSDARRRNGSRRIEFYIAGAMLGAAAVVAFYGAANFAELTIAFIALQAGLNVAIGPYQAIVPDFVERSRFGRASSWMAALQSVGNAVGALCATLVNDARLLGGMLGALVLSTCAITCRHIRALPLQAEGAPVRIQMTRAFGDLFISRALVYVGFYTLLGYLLFYVNGVLGAPSIEIARRQTGILILCFTLVGVVGAVLAARPSDRLDKRLVATCGGLTMAIALVLFILSHSFTGAIVATVVAGLGWGIFLVADWALVCRILPQGTLAFTMGVWNLALILPQLVAPWLTTAVLQALAVASSSQGPRWAFGLAVCETLLGIAWLWRLSHSAVGE